MGAKEENLRVARLARAVWGQYGTEILREWEAQKEAAARPHSVL